MLAEEFPHPGSRHLRDGWDGCNYVLEAIDSSTFHVYAEEHWRGHSPLGFSKKGMCLVSGDDVALEQNDAAGLKHRKAVAELRGELRAIETENEELADLGAKIFRG